jgi:RHS repeat-associated protein
VGNFYIYSFDGKLLQTYDVYGALLKDYIYMSDRLVAEYDNVDHRLLYYTPDQINSTRVVTDPVGNVVYWAVHDPYGGIQLTGQNNTYDPQLKFSGKERDIESQLDYFGARYYDRSIFRFLSVDNVQSWSPRLYEPQLQNLYTYAVDNPLVFLDLEGEFPVYISIVRTGLNPEGGVTGRFSVETPFGSMTGYTLECPYKGYELARKSGSESAIEAGIYSGELVYDCVSKSGAKYDSIQLSGDALGSRTLILIHNGTKIGDSTGCILVGLNPDMVGAREEILRFIGDSQLCSVLLAFDSLPSISWFPEITVDVSFSASYVIAVNRAFLAWQKNSGVLNSLFKK